MKKILLLILFLAIPFFTYAESFPDFPMAFWGNATLNNQPLIAGTKIVAYCNNEIIGQLTMSENGTYGYNDSLKNKLLVKNCNTSIIFKYIPIGQTISLAGDSSVNYSQGFISGNTINKNLDFINDETYIDNTGSAIINSTAPKVVINNSNQTATITINSGTFDPKIDVSSFISNGTGTLPAINITSTNANNTIVAIPASTVVTSSDTTWNGIIAAPTTTTITIPSTSTETKTLSTAIEVGFVGAKLSFNKAVRILLPGQAGKRAGYIRTGISFTEITSTCSDDSQAAGDSLVVDGDCKKDIGNDLVIWTKHFTSFASFTSTTIDNSNTNSGGSNGGGGGVSAGSITMGQNIESSVWKGRNQNIVDLKDFTGLNFVPFVISVHIDESNIGLIKEKAKETGYPVIALTDKQALLIDGERQEIVGEGDKITFNIKI